MKKLKYFFIKVIFAFDSKQLHHWIIFCAVGEKMNKEILFCQFGGLGEKAIQETLKKMGYNVESFWVKAENYDYDSGLLNRFVERMKKRKVDFVFSINFLPIISKVCNIFKTIYISWIYDSPELHLYSSALKNSVNRIFLFDRMQYSRFYPVSPENIFYMPLATQPMSEKEMQEITRKEHQLYDSEICFIGSLYNEKDKRFHELTKLPDYWKGYIQGIAEAQLNVFGYNFIADSLTDQDVTELRKLLEYELVDDYQEVDREIIADMYIGPMVSAMDRNRTVQRISENHKVTLYTGSDTRNFTNVENRGLADSITMMPKIFHCSKINLNITSKTIQTGIPLRVFDVLGAGGFLITNYQQELMEYFEPGVDLVVYEDMDDLETKITYYLQHEEERQQIALNGYHKVCQCYTYEIALREILMCVGIK